MINHSHHFNRLFIDLNINSAHKKNKNLFLQSIILSSGATKHTEMSKITFFLPPTGRNMVEPPSHALHLLRNEAFCDVLVFGMGNPKEGLKLCETRLKERPSSPPTQIPSSKLLVGQ